MSRQPTQPQSSRLDDAIRARVRALPGTLTYLDLMRRNRRASAMLLATMMLLTAVLGAAIGGAIGTGYGTEPARLIPPMVVGAGCGLLVAIVASVWSWYGGSAMVLRIAHARPVDRDEDPELHNVVEELSLAAGLPVPRVYLIGDSAMNAFATGRDPAHAAVAITRGLRERLTRDELQGVLAHEMAHIRHLDVRFAMLMATMVGLIALVCDAIWRGTFRHGRLTRSGHGRGGGAVQAVLVVAALLLALVAPFVATLIQLAYSRQREFLADAGAVELTRYPQGLASALRKLAADEEPLVDTANRGTAHMYIVNPLRRSRRQHHELNSLFSSHPPIGERIARLLALAR